MQQGAHLAGAVARGIAFSLAAASSLLAQQAAADLLTPVADGRYVFVDHCPAFEPCQSESARPPSPFAPFDAEMSIVDMSASQNSSLTGGAEQSSMGGSLAAGSPAEPPLGNTLGDANFDFSVLPEPDLASSLASGSVLTSLLARRRARRLRC